MAARASDGVGPAYVGRLAPSPSGPMHMGIARTFLVAWLDARTHQGRLILRIEDIDEPRSRPGSDQSIMRDLEWLGLEWDEGPGDGGPAGPYYQSERKAHYERALENLRRQDRTYLCYCTRKEIADASAPHGPEDEGPRYPGTCRAGAEPHPGRSPAVRLATQADELVRFDDVLFGPLEQDVHQAVGDFIIRRTDGLWAYQLAVSVDDLEQGVTRIVRGADLLSSTGRQLLIRRLLAPDAPPIDTLHVPLVLDRDGHRLATRKGAVSIEALRARGDRPEQVIGALAASFGWVEPGTECRPEGLLALYQPTRLSKDSTILG